jgi:nitric oxide synthase oxygenase domain/subunit
MRVLEEEHRAVSLNQLTGWLSWLTAPIGPGSSAIYFSGFSHRMKFSEVDN